MFQQKSVKKILIPEISNQAILYIEDIAYKELSWNINKYKTLTIQSLQTWKWGFLNKDILNFEITLSILSGGRSAIKVFHLIFKGNLKSYNKL